MSFSRVCEANKASCPQSQFYLSPCSTRQPLELWLWPSPRLQQDPLRPPPPRRRLSQRDLSGAAAAGRVVAVVGRQPALLGGNSHGACDHSDRHGDGRGSCGDGGAEQEAEQRKEVGCWVTDTNLEPRTDESSLEWQGCSTLTDTKWLFIYSFYALY